MTSGLQLVYVFLPYAPLTKTNLELRAQFSEHQAQNYVKYCIHVYIVFV